MVHVAVNEYQYDFVKINILEYAFGEGGGGHQEAYAVYAFVNVDNCELGGQIESYDGVTLANLAIFG